MRRWILVALATVLCCVVHADELPSPPLLADMIAPAEIATMALAPDGKHTAGLINSKFGPLVYLMDLSDLKTRILRMPRTSSRYGWRKPAKVTWIQSDLLAIDFNSEQSEAVDFNGKRVANLGERFIRRMHEKGTAGDWVLAYSDLRNAEIDLVNARSGERRSYRIGLPGRLYRWAFDAAGELRAVMMVDTAFWSEQTRISNWYRPDPQSPWQLLEEAPITGDYWVPLRVLPEPNMIAVLSRRGRDTWAVFRYDTVTKQPVRLMAGHDDEDVLGVTGLDDSSFLSVITNGLKPDRDWFEPRWARLQSSVDAELPGRVNTLTGDPDGRVLIASYGDVDPGRWFLLDAASMAMRELGPVQSRIDPKRMRPMETMRYKARDGLAVNAYLTRPARPSGQPAPTVVLIHGGPNVRDQWAWNEEVQILASYGYVVFQPQFRGSSGFGRRFEEAGYGQWGLAMQDDITDGVNELIARRIADPGRICIYGASYGGYAALWGVIKTPTLYKCGISFAGVSDLEAWVAGSIFDDSDSVARELKRARIGDATKQRAQFAEVSPVNHAARVQVPLLVAHGESDTRVLPSQSRKMVDALRRNGKDVEWMPFPGEWHGLVHPDHQLRYYAAVLSFLQRHIGDGAAAAPAAAASAAP